MAVSSGTGWREDVSVRILPGSCRRTVSGFFTTGFLTGLAIGLETCELRGRLSFLCNKLSVGAWPEQLIIMQNEIKREKIDFTKCGYGCKNIVCTE